MPSLLVTIARYWSKPKRPKRREMLAKLEAQMGEKFDAGLSARIDAELEKCEAEEEDARAS